jgi:hypothetical protein
MATAFVLAFGSFINRRIKMGKTKKRLRAEELKRRFSEDASKQDHKNRVNGEPGRSLDQPDKEISGAWPLLIFAALLALVFLAHWLRQ